MDGVRMDISCQGYIYIYGASNSEWMNVRPVINPCKGKVQSRRE